jgi:glucose/arabinose dehydrogenase/mono/diheme cytochrome c family protein
VTPSSASSVRILALVFALGTVIAACQRHPDPIPAPSSLPNGGLRLPDGFEAVVVIDSLGPARHLVVNENGDIYVKLRSVYDDGGLVALRDSNGDGRADVVQRFGLYPRTGNYETAVAIHKGHLYFSTNLQVYRYPLTDALLPDTTALETILVDDHEHGVHQHQTKPVAFDDQGRMYVPFGVPSDTCQDPDRTPGVMGQDPCPELVDHGGIWVFSDDRPNQTQADGTLFATGIRSVVDLKWNPLDRHLYALQHGRDYLFRQWPDHYDRWESALLPAEELQRVTEGADFGWPYCHYDQLQGRRILNPEYGGDGLRIGRCLSFTEPHIGFPGHFAPNGLLFYGGDQFPEYYRHGAFVAFHGSTIRDPYSQAGYFVAFVPSAGGELRREWDVFANGFALVDPIVSTSNARHRPIGLAQGPDGSLYISDSVVGTIWKVSFTGDRASFGPAQRARMDQEGRTASNVRTPHPTDDNLEREVAIGGEALYQTYCAACHSRDGEGSPPRFPPIVDTEWTTGDADRLISIVLYGMSGPITVRGELYDSAMPAHDSFLTDEEVAQLLSYVRAEFGGGAANVSPEEVRRLRR